MAFQTFRNKKHKKDNLNPQCVEYSFQNGQCWAVIDRINSILWPTHAKFFGQT